MNLIILKTNLTDHNKVKAIQSVLNAHPKIKEWSVDTEDVDKVLRIETKKILTEEEVIQLIRKHGFNCEILSN